MRDLGGFGRLRRLRMSAASAAGKMLEAILGVPTSETEGGEVEGGEVAALAGARVGQKLYMPSRRFWRRSCRPVSGGNWYCNTVE